MRQASWHKLDTGALTGPSRVNTLYGEPGQSVRTTRSLMTRSKQLRTQQASTDDCGTRDSDTRVLHTSGQELPGRPTARPMARREKSGQDRGSPAKRSSHSRSTPGMPLPQTAYQTAGTGPDRSAIKSASRVTGPAPAGTSSGRNRGTQPTTRRTASVTPTPPLASPARRAEPRTVLRDSSLDSGETSARLSPLPVDRARRRGPRPTNSFSPPSH